LPGLVHNYRAAIAAKRSDLKAAQEHLRQALRQDPYHYPVARNAEAMRRYFAQGGETQQQPLTLEAYHEFQLFERTTQPTLPGALSADFWRWEAEQRPMPAAQPEPPKRLPMVRA
jgi:hypothetical protein